MGERSRHAQAEWLLSEAEDVLVEANDQSCRLFNSHLDVAQENVELRSRIARAWELLDGTSSTGTPSELLAQLAMAHMAIRAALEGGER